MTAEEIQRPVEAAPDRYRALVILGAGCDLRLGEALGLKVARVRFLERELAVVDGEAGTPQRREQAFELCRWTPSSSTPWLRT